MQLYHRRFGNPGNPAIVILHGLAGSSRDWVRTAEALADHYCVHTPDLRNHGESPHSEVMDYEHITEDLLYWSDSEGLKHFHLIGHSNGGKAAMHFACHHPGRVQSLTVIDMAPKAYDASRTLEFDAMAALEDRGSHTLEEANAFLKKDIPDKDMRAYLLQEWDCDTQGQYHWRMNHRLLAKRLKEIRGKPLQEGDQYPGPVLFMRGGKSTFIENSDTPAIQRYFPQARIETLAGSNHFPHHVAFQEFITLVREFIQEHEAPYGRI